MAAELGNRLPSSIGASQLQVKMRKTRENVGLAAWT